MPKKEELLICTRCNKTKRESEFYKDKKCGARGGRQYHCKECVKDIRKQYYDENSEEVNHRVREYQRRNPGRKGKPCRANKSQRLLNRAVRRGDIHKPDRCEDCGKVGYLHAHHHNGYEAPYDIVWLCPSCHHAAHGRGPKARVSRGEYSAQNARGF